MMIKKLDQIQNNIENQDQESIESQIIEDMKGLKYEIHQKIEKQKEDIMEYQNIRDEGLKENQDRLVQIDNQASSSNQEKDRFIIDDIETLNSFIDLGLDK